MNQFGNQQFGHQQGDEVNSHQSSDREMLMLPCDQRYRTSHYFLADQLRCSEAIADFRSVRELLSKVANIDPLAAFQQHMQEMPVRLEPE